MLQGYRLASAITKTKISTTSQRKHQTEDISDKVSKYKQLVSDKANS